MLADTTTLVLGLYEAVLGGPGLMPALDHVAERIEARGYTVHRLRYDREKPVGTIAAGRGNVDATLLDEYARYWVRYDPRLRPCASLPLGVHDLADSVPADEVRRSRFWREWGQAHGAALHVLATLLAREGDNLTGVFFLRPEAAPPFGSEERALITQIFPHLQRVFAGEAQLASVRETPGLVLRAGLDAMPDGIALLDTDRRLIFANVALRRMAAEGDGLALAVQGGLDAPEPRARHALARAVTAALAAADGKVGLLPSAGTLALPRPSGRAPWLVRAVPLLPDPSMDLPSGFRGAKLLVSDPERRPRPAAALLARLFGLTPAEAALAASLASGRTLDQHARARKIARETARTQLAAVRRKTGCRSQTELAVLLTRLPG